MPLPKSLIEAVKERVDLLALVRRHGVDLTPGDRSHKGRCPFHATTTHAFYVWPAEGTFQCFVCQAKGDAIAFVQRLTGRDFEAVVVELAAEVGLEPEVPPEVLAGRALQQATDFAAHHFTRHLWGPEGEGARAYLRGRGVTEEAARAFGLGWAPARWTDLSDALPDATHRAGALAVGLLAPQAHGSGPLDVFRGRVVFPIRSPDGRTLAFGGRLLEGAAASAGPTYLNSRASPLYAKSEVLYGADQAREAIQVRRATVLCEGYFDCLALHRAGVTHAVALCSTALTADQLALLWRLGAREVVLLLDGDAAGREAVERMAGLLLSSGLSARVAAVPDGLDPDTLLAAVGAEGLRAVLAAAVPLLRHLLEAVLPAAAAAGFEEKMAGLARLRPVLATVPRGPGRAALLVTVARHFGLPAPELEAALSRPG